METRLCYISRNYNNFNKARTDTEQTIVELGGVNLGLRQSFYKSKVVAFLLNFAGIVKYACSVRKGDLLFLQYPQKKYFKLVCRIAHRRGARVIALIHDLGSMRRRRISVEEELFRLIQVDYLIASNESMRQWLLAEGYWKPIGAMGFWDYLTPAHPAEHTPSATRRIVYAGQLAMRKNAFLLQLQYRPLSYELHVYGDERRLPIEHQNPNVFYHGEVNSDWFVSQVQGDFGLVWDGDSLDWYSGDWGAYLRYNSPHKVSFYLRAGLPVIAHRNAALAPLIEQEGVGLLVGSFREIDELLPTITEARLAELRANVARVAQQISSGYYLRTAVASAIQFLTQNN